MRRVILAVGLWWFAVGLSTGVWADGETRPATEAEKEFIGRVLVTLDKAVPSGPSGWSLVERTEVQSPERLTVGQEKFPVRLSYRVAWQDQEQKNEFDARVDEIVAKKAAEGKTDTSLEALLRQQEELAAAIGAAVERGDMAEVERLQKELESIAQKLEQSYSQEEQGLNAEVRAEEPHDVDADIQIVVNEFADGFQHDFLEEPPVAGAPAYRIQDEGETNYGWQEGSTCVFLGNWRLVREENSVMMSADLRPELPHTAVQTLIVRVRAEETRARDLLGSMDWKALKALIEP